MNYELKYDVVVLGAGPSGFGAAVASARNGAKTALIERYGFCGGMASAAGIGAAIASKGRCPINEIDVAQLQAKLR